MIDIHTHLLPGVDDGSSSIDESIPVLRAFAAAGVRTVVCTPHLKASEGGAAPFEHHAELRRDLQVRTPPEITLLGGWEIMLDRPGVDLLDPRLALGDSNALLVEFTHTALPPNSAAELFRIRSGGRVPVVAHPERYWGCTLRTVEEWRRAGAVIQMDVTAIFGSGRMSDLSRELLGRGLCDMFASDTHVDYRSLGPLRDWLLEFGTQEHATLLTRVNAERLLASEPMLPVPPLRLGSGVVERLRKLFLGGRRR
jgi:protein-tyrosine phosphatase